MTNLSVTLLLLLDEVSEEGPSEGPRGVSRIKSKLVPFSGYKNDE